MMNLSAAQPESPSRLWTREQTSQSQLSQKVSLKTLIGLLRVQSGLFERASGTARARRTELTGCFESQRALKLTQKSLQTLRLLTLAYQSGKPAARSKEPRRTFASSQGS